MPSAKSAAHQRWLLQQFFEGPNRAYYYLGIRPDNFTLTEGSNKTPQPAKMLEGPQIVELVSISASEQTLLKQSTRASTYTEPPFTVKDCSQSDTEVVKSGWKAPWSKKKRAKNSEKSNEVQGNDDTKSKKIVASASTMRNIMTSGFPVKDASDIDGGSTTIKATRKAKKKEFNMLQAMFKKEKSKARNKVVVGERAYGLEEHIEARLRELPDEEWKALLDERASVICREIKEMTEQKRPVAAGIQEKTAVDQAALNNAVTLVKLECVRNSSSNK